MNIKTIYTKNATYQKFEVLKTNRNKRFKYGEFFVEGVRNINEAIKNNWEISSFLYSDERELSSWAQNILATVKTEINYNLSWQLMADISSKEDTSELLAIVKMRDDELSSIKSLDIPLIVLFDRPSNKGNLGTIIRSCDSFGVDGIIITGHAVDMYEADVISASMGSFFSIPTIRVSDNENLMSYIDTLKEKYPDLQIVGTTAHKEKLISELDFKKPTILMLGNETDGLNRKFKELSDDMATIPMSDNSSATSFNVACAATVVLYEAIRQRM